RNAPALWRAISTMVDEDAQFAQQLKLRFVGKVDISAKEELKILGLWDHVEIIDYMPHDKLMQYLTGSQVLLLLVNQSKNARMILTGKVFEYLKAERPILAVAPKDGDLSKLIAETRSGVVCAFNDKEAMVTELRSMWDAHLLDKLTVKSSDVKRFSRQNLTHELAQLFDELQHIQE
ncbi:MAG: hypothetical protein HKN32_05245, partial [Flavobacteriales bacterium]|nr:hypothetical protein [Flavobacteriales bacterium]